MQKYIFPNNFLWGAAASGVQTEGITNKVNKSTWEHWYSIEPNRFYNQYSNYIACDTYNRYKEDAQLMKNINMNSFRTSIQWSRLIRDFETMEPDKDAIQFYTNYFKEMNKNGVAPIINLYHFDMPIYLQDKYGGFESKVVAKKFSEYADLCFKLFSPYVNKWLTFNEPIVPVEFSYLDCHHYPNVINPALGMQVLFNTQLASSLAIKKFRTGNYPGEIGIALNLTPVYSRSNNPADLEAAKFADDFHNRSYMDPAIFGTFPKELLEVFEKDNIMFDASGEELEVIKNNTVDFVGVNYYLPRRAKAPQKLYNPKAPWHYSNYFDHYELPGGRQNPHRDNNEIYPEAIYDIGMRIKNEYNNIPWYVSEIGISMTNEDNLMTDGMVNDEFRTQIFIEHMMQLHKAIKEGSNCFGVHQWTFIDNWSWLNSHKRRYGFYYLDLETRDRKIKKHALWFKDMVSNNGFEV